ncbi:hypothetical protein E2C01_086971 [Portunus trituberculatus]|uniref:Uncharacterized protein n=1 Tax=Portunus trituberculatus TaxID=210409 RepID=A0A5B7JG29_PORTR|nr:hypothetical protein [Portunus trituberculatus]
MEAAHLDTAQKTCDKETGNDPPPWAVSLQRDTIFLGKNNENFPVDDGQLPLMPHCAPNLPNDTFITLNIFHLFYEASYCTEQVWGCRGNS